MKNLFGLIKKNKIKTIIIFAIILFAKIMISFQHAGPYMFSDESCVIEKAKYLAQTGTLETCKYIVGAPAGDPLPGYSIAISPIYMLFDGYNAYLAILIFNAILASILFWPLLSITKKTVPDINENLAILITMITLFTPQVVLYEKMVLTESFFLFNTIWFLYFYSKGLELDKFKYKIVAVIFGLIASITRPFGFIILMAMVVNELLISKHKKQTFLVLLPITIFAIGLAFFLLGNIVGEILHKIKNFSNLDAVLNALISVKNSVTTILVGTFIFTSIIFLDHIWDEKNTYVAKFKWFLLSLVFFNIAIVSYHIYGYLILGTNLDLLSRYLNISIILINFFGMVFMAKTKVFEPTTRKVIITSIFLVTLLLFKFNESKHSLNLDFMLYFDETKINALNQAEPNIFLKLFFIPICALLVAASYIDTKTKRVFFSACTLLFIIQGCLTYNYNASFSTKIHEDRLYAFFKDTKANVLLITSYKDRFPDLDLWRLRSTTENNIQLAYLNDLKTDYPIPNFDQEYAKKQIENFDYVLTKYPLNLEPLFDEPRGKIVYKVNHDEQP